MSWQRVIKIFIWLWFAFIALVLLKTGSRIFVGDWFPVNTTSMTPTIVPGDKIWVNKLIFGARIYKNLDFLDGKPLETFRVKGWRKIRRGDVVVFNAPIQKSNLDSIGFRIDYVYVKRCMGLPGDTVRIHRRAERINPQDSLYRMNRHRYVGAIYVPKKGDTLHINRQNLRRYRTVIAYETNGILPVDYHVFRNNYYFVGGDNTLQSYDSRHFGFVPEEFIIGVSKRVLFNNRDGWKQRYKGRRILHRFP
ncbi:MAG: signal peptidase I [Bacteroidales bacterium]|nr:signal peptidase I [Bacteroidales bacterium]MCL2739199.1 signal peptidase I [Bacteroidales bacterium]